jgi:hypothetical protein
MGSVIPPTPLVRDVDELSRRCRSLRACFVSQVSSEVSAVRGVAQCVSGQPNKPEALSDMRRADARSAQISRPEGVARCFHVSVYKVEPAEAVLACNLLAKDD